MHTIIAPNNISVPATPFKKPPTSGMYPRIYTSGLKNI